MPKRSNETLEEYVDRVIADSEDAYDEQTAFRARWGK